MNIYVYSDESGVFDNDYFVFAGLICIGTNEKEIWSRKYSAVEKTLRKSKGVKLDYELKATRITNSEKGKLFRSLNNCYKFGVVIREKNVLDRIYYSKKDKQRYLDYAYKIAVKRAFENLITIKSLDPNQVERIYFYVDEQESLEQEFKLGTYNYHYNTYYPPIFSNIKDIQLQYCNSESKLLVRAADIVANKIYYLAQNKMYSDINNISKINIVFLP